MKTLYSLWVAAKIVLWGIFTTINTCIRKEIRWKIKKQSEKGRKLEWK